MSQHKLNLYEKKPAKWKRKEGKVLFNRDLFGESVEGKRPKSTGVVIGQKDWQVDDGIFLRSRPATYSGSPSSFCNFSSTSTCYNCVYDEKKGREFCEIMGSSYCKKCIKTTRQKEINEEVSSTLGISGNGYTSPLGNAFFATRSTLACSNDRSLFIRLHNLNSYSSEYYINPTNGIGNALASNEEILNENGSNHTSNLFQVPDGDKEASQRSFSKKKRKIGATGIAKRKFVTFNGLPIEPPLITVDLSNQIMNHLVISDS